MVLAKSLVFEVNLIFEMPLHECSLFKAAVVNGDAQTCMSNSSWK